jgi:hypothetical protein
VNKYGQKLQAVAGAKGNATRTLHGAFLAALANSLPRARIKFNGAGRNNRPCKNIVSHLKKTFVGADERTQRKLKGFIADLLVDCIGVAASAPDGPNAQRFSQ